MLSSSANVESIRVASRRVSRVSRGALIVCVFVLIYASLNPFLGWQFPRNISLFVWPTYFTLFDVVVNVAAYLPFGGLVAHSLRRLVIRSHATHPLLRAWIGTFLIGLLFSLTLETIQLFLPSRIASPLDILTNTTGTVIGAGFALATASRKMIAAVVYWRARTFAHHRSTGWGLMLLTLWFVAQLNPAIPFFEAGLISSVNPAQFESAATPQLNAYDPLVLLPQAVGIALNVAAFALLISILLHPKKRVLLNVGLVMVVGLLAKLTMAALMLKAPLIAASLSPATVIGVCAGVFTFIFFSDLRYRWRAFWATLLVFAGGVMSKLSSVYSALDETLRLFNWPYGQLANFASLTHWVNEIWPLAALFFLATVFIRTKRY